MKTIRFLAVLVVFCGNSASQAQSIIRNPEPLEIKGDIASHLVDGVDRFLLREIAEADGARVSGWKAGADAAGSKEKYFATKRSEFSKMLGIRDTRVGPEPPRLLATAAQSSLLGKNDQFEVHAISMPVLDGLTLQGLWLRPLGEITGNMVVVPDADQTPESLAGLTDDLPVSEQIARQFASRGQQVVVPVIISREMKKRRGRANLSNREFLYRSAFELGRHLIGYEIQKILAVVDWYKESTPELQVGVWGTGEGGMLSLYAAALDSRIDKVAVDDFLGGREKNWQYPISRNVFGLLSDFGDAEVLTLITPRPVLHIHNPKGVTVSQPSEGGAPAQLNPATEKEVERVIFDYRQHIKNFGLDNSLTSISHAAGQFTGSIDWFAKSLPPKSVYQPKETANVAGDLAGIRPVRQLDVNLRMNRQIEEVDRFNQRILTTCENDRKEFMKKLDTSSVENYKKSSEEYRKIFAEEIVGRFDLPLKEFNARARPFCDHEKYVGYEVVLDVFDDVIAYGIILLPKGMKPDEKRPVVVCQHGLEGRPQDIVQGDHGAYHDFAAKLAEEGFITFSPQNLYIFRDRFRTLQRKANTIGKTLFSVIVPQHQQIVNWLKSLPNVDSERIAFYGLSYGGKSAMRIPPLVTDYCLSICSADFNEWVWKNASTSSPYSYVWTGEYEIFEFDLGTTFNYAEMAALIAPRPFMVERGHFDGVSSDERVAYEFAKVRHLYQAKLKIGDRCEIEFFDGPHTINGRGTFAFLRKHLNWPPKR